MTTPISSSTQPAIPKPHYDVFISHATEDKDDFARPLAAELKRLGLKVWYDEWTLTLGDSLRAKIDEGLASSDFGIVVLSHSFFAQGWGPAELNGLFARENRGKKVILPIRHGLTHEDVIKYSPLLADKLAALTEKGVATVAQQILAVVHPSANLSPVATPAVIPTVSVTISAEDLQFYQALVNQIVTACRLTHWQSFVHDMCKVPPVWDGQWTDDVEKLVTDIQRTVWPKTIPVLEVAILCLTHSLACAFEVLDQHVHYENGKYRGRAFYKDFGHNPNYDQDLKLFKAWIIEYMESLANLVKALNWFSDAIRINLDRTFFRKEGYFTLVDDPQPLKYSADEIGEITQGITEFLK